MSSDKPPDLHMLNLVVADMAASLDFYQRLGIAISGDAAGAHVQLTMPGGFSLELDTAESARTGRNLTWLNLVRTRGLGELPPFTDVHCRAGVPLLRRRH